MQTKGKVKIEGKEFSKVLTNIKTALRVNLIGTSLLYDLPMNLRTKFSVANSVTDLQKIYVCVQILCKF